MPGAQCICADIANMKETPRRRINVTSPLKGLGHQIVFKHLTKIDRFWPTVDKGRGWFLNFWSGLIFIITVNVPAL